MCQLLKRISLFCVLLLLSVSLLASDFQNINPELFLDNPQEMQQSFKNVYNNLNQNSNDALPNLSLQMPNLFPLNLELMSAWELLDNLEVNWSNAMQHLEAAIQSSKNSEKELLATKLELQNVKASLNSCRQALLSNKDDTHEVIEELGRLQEKITKLDTEVLNMTRKRDAWRTATFVATPIAAGLGFILGCIFTNKYIK